MNDHADQHDDDRPDHCNGVPPAVIDLCVHLHDAQGIVGRVDALLEPEPEEPHRFLAPRSSKQHHDRRQCRKYLPHQRRGAYGRMRGFKGIACLLCRCRMALRCCCARTTEMPTTEYTMVKNLPNSVTGTKSPYPTVVAVTMRK